MLNTGAKKEEIVGGIHLSVKLGVTSSNAKWQRHTRSSVLTILLIWPSFSSREKKENLTLES